MKHLTSSFTVRKVLSISHILTIICIVLAFFFSNFFQNVISSIGILSFGVIHGANDLMIIAKKKEKGKRIHQIKMFSLYLCIVFLGMFIFYFIPEIALFGFVIVSSYHFGEQHWESRLKKHKTTPFFYFSYGALIFFLLFSIKFKDSAEVIFQISKIEIPLTFFLIFLIIFAIVFFSQAFVRIRDIKVLGYEFLLIGILSILFYFGTLIYGFGVYFVLWHSIPSLKSQIKFLYKKNDFNSLISYLKTASLYWIISIFSLFLIYFYGNIPEEQYLSVFFSFLAAITFPHAIVMGLMFYSKDPN